MPDVASMVSLISFDCRRVSTPALAMALLVRIPTGGVTRGLAVPRHGRGAPACHLDLTDTGYTGHTWFHEVMRGFCPSPSLYIPLVTLWITGLTISIPKVVTKILGIIEYLELEGIHKDHRLQIPAHQEASPPQYKVFQVRGASEGGKTPTRKGLKTEKEVLKGKE